MNEITKTGTAGISSFLNQKNVLDKFANILGEKAQGFIASVITAVNSNDLLKNATQESVYSCALMAAALDLPINQNLGLAYFIPYNNKKSGKQECQFQIGYKGFIQLAIRSGQFRHLDTCKVYETDTDEEIQARLRSIRKLSKSETVTGYAGIFTLINGYEHSLFMSIDELQFHGTKYSQSYKSGFGLWKDNFEAMATKTVLKLLLSKYAPLSVEMQKAVISDQAVIKNPETLEVEYVDNQPDTAQTVDAAKETQRIIDFLAKAKTIEELEMLKDSIEGDFDVQLIENRKEQILNSEK